LKVKASPPFLTYSAFADFSEGEGASRESDYCERLNIVFILKKAHFCRLSPFGGTGAFS